MNPKDSHASAAETLQLTKDLLDRIFGQQTASNSLQDYRFLQLEQRTQRVALYSGRVLLCRRRLS